MAMTSSYRGSLVHPFSSVPLTEVRADEEELWMGGAAGLRELLERMGLAAGRGACSLIEAATGEIL